ncbi:MAG: hypothetical protein H0W68_03425 [Gemmatimonadaceae bacterium]|nr:hypothetical protein [Gemmatimonadaceae bacterium]
MRRIRRLVLGVALMVPSADLMAQERTGGGAERMQPGGPDRRQDLERQLRRGFWQAAKRRIGLTDDQMTRLEQTTARFDPRRRALAQDERSTRVQLHFDVLADSSGNDQRIAAALDRMLQLQRQRIDLLIEEQRELATFMSPRERAQYGALQEQMRRRVEELRRARPEDRPGRLRR